MIRAIELLLNKGLMGTIIFGAFLLGSLAVIAYLLIKIVPKINIKKIKAGNNEIELGSSVRNELIVSTTKSVINGNLELVSFEDKYIKQLISLELDFHKSFMNQYEQAVKVAIAKLNLIFDEQTESEEDENEKTLIDLIIEKEIRKSLSPILDIINNDLEKNQLIEQADIHNFASQINDDLMLKAKVYPRISREIIMKILKRDMKENFISILQGYINKYNNLTSEKIKRINEINEERIKYLEIMIKSLIGAK